MHICMCIYIQREKERERESTYLYGEKAVEVDVEIYRGNIAECSQRLFLAYEINKNLSFILDTFVYFSDSL